MVLIVGRELRFAEALEAEFVYSDKVYEAKRKAEEYSKEGGLIAPSYLVMRNFPFVGSVIANTEEYYIPNGKFKGERGNFLLTLHGGVDGELLLTHEKLKKAYDLCITPTNKVLRSSNTIDYLLLYPNDRILQMLAGSERLPENITEPMFSYAELAACLNSSARFWERRGIKADMTTERANIEQLLPPDSHFKLEDVFDGEDVIRNIVEGVMPDGTTIPIFTYEQVLANEHYDYMQEFKRFGVVQPYRKERQSNGRENGKDVSELVDKKGQVIDPELTILAGGHEEAQEFMNRYIAFHASDNCNIKHLTKSPSFDPEKPQCRLIGITGNEPDKCVTSPAFFGNGRYMGVTADKLQGEREMLSSPAYKQVMEQIGAAIGKHVPERFRKELWHAMRNELSFTLSRQYYKTIRKSGMLSNPDQLVRIIESATKTAFLPEAHQKFMEDVSNMVTFTYAGFNYKLNISPSRADAPEKAEEPVEAAETPSETEETAEPKK